MFFVLLIWCEKWLFVKLNWVEFDNVIFFINWVLFMVVFVWLIRFNELVWVVLWFNVNWFCLVKFMLLIKFMNFDVMRFVVLDNCMLLFIFVFGNELIVFLLVNFFDLYWVSFV